MLPFDYIHAIYRKNNFGQPCVWHAEPYAKNEIMVYHGILGKTITKDIIYTERNLNDEIESRYKAKRKTGYKHLSELKDNVHLPVERELITYLTQYLPDDRTTADGSVLPMLAKAYDNTNNKLFKKCSGYTGQYKINGLRCFISAVHTPTDMFKPISLKFQSREGTYWNSLTSLEEELLHLIPKRFLEKMVEEHYILDGELYLPGKSVNEINHFVKDPNCFENKLIQYWCYDAAIEDMTQYNRIQILRSNFELFFTRFNTKEEHLRNVNRLIMLEADPILNGEDATEFRDKYIDLGFEGLILRNPDAEYQFGKRNQSMIKYKRATDGKFVIVDIIPEGYKRPDIPLLICKNDINEQVFEVHLSSSLDFQRQVLKNKHNYIGKTVFITYGERSGVHNLPFHVKQVELID